MTSRERWTVYPLLFLAIGLALRAVAVPPDKLAVGVVEASRIVCGEIVVAADGGTKLVHIGRVKGGGGGRIEVNDDSGVEAIAIGTGLEHRDGFVEFFNGEGQPIGRLSPGGPPAEPPPVPASVEN
ncbi:MAG: hypothetical protein K8S94_01125 [Planctomycetia bacterium]|nr:hypothetical protein [Planctomycetia bacterium]